MAKRFTHCHGWDAGGIGPHACCLHHGLATQHRFGQGTWGSSAAGQPVLPWLLHSLATLAASTGLFFTLFLPIIHGSCKEIQNHVRLFIGFCYFLWGECVGWAKSLDQARHPVYSSQSNSMHFSGLICTIQLQENVAEANAGQANLVLSTRDREEKASSFFLVQPGFGWGNSSRIDSVQLKNQCWNKGISGEKSSYLNHIYSCTGVKHGASFGTPPGETCRRPVGSSCTPLEVGHQSCNAARTGNSSNNLDLWERFLYLSPQLSL